MPRHTVVSYDFTATGASQFYGGTSMPMVEVATGGLGYDCW